MAMTLDEFREKVRECLVKQIGEKQTAVLMKTYEDDFIEFMEKDYNPETAAMAMLMGY